MPRWRAIADIPPGTFVIARIARRRVPTSATWRRPSLMSTDARLSGTTLETCRPGPLWHRSTESTVRPWDLRLPVLVARVDGVDLAAPLDETTFSRVYD